MLAFGLMDRPTEGLVRTGSARSVVSGLFCGLLGCVWAASLSAPARGQEVADSPYTVGPAYLDTQVAQGISGYEIPGRDVTVGRGETVRNRPRPSYDALGARAGSFYIFPQVVAEEQFETNIFRTSGNEESDFITRIAPSVNVESDWSRHALSIGGGASFGIYADNNDENYEDYFANTNGRLDITPDTNLRTRVGYRHEHEDRSSPDDAAGVEPTEFDVLFAGLTLAHDFGRINTSISGDASRRTFEDVQAAGGGTILEHNRDRNAIEAALRVGYEILREYEAFIRATYNVVRYDSHLDNSGVDRDSNGYGVAAGMAVDFGGLIFGDFFAGYRYQNYDDPTLSSTTGVGAGADITWNVTGLTTVNARASSDIRETTTGGASGAVLSTVALSVDHELLRNLILGASGSVSRDAFDGINRTDWVFGGGVNADYLMNRYLQFGVDYNYTERSAGTGGVDFRNHRVLARVRVQY